MTLFLAASFRDFIVLTLASLLVPGVLFWILNTVLKTANNLKRAWANLILGGVFILLFLVSFLVDNLAFMRTEGFLAVLGDVVRLRSLAFLAGFLGWTVVLFAVNASRGHHANQRLTRTSRLRVPSLQEYLALVYRKGEDLYLLDNGSALSPVKVPFDRSRFPAEIINATSARYKVVMETDDAVGTVRRVGTLTVTGEKKKYECYLIDSLTAPVGSFRAVDPRMLATETMDPVDQEIVLRTLLRESFDIVK